MYGYPLVGFPGGLEIKNLPSNAGASGDMDSVLGWEDSLEEGMATHSGILAWEIPWTDEPDGLQCMESQRVRYK